VFYKINITARREGLSPKIKDEPFLRVYVPLRPEREPGDQWIPYEAWRWDGKQWRKKYGILRGVPDAITPAELIALAVKDAGKFRRGGATAKDHPTSRTWGVRRPFGGKSRPQSKASIRRAIDRDIQLGGGSY